MRNLPSDEEVFSLLSKTNRTMKPTATQSEVDVDESLNGTDFLDRWILEILWYCKILYTKCIQYQIFIISICTFIGFFPGQFEQKGRNVPHPTHNLSSNIKFPIWIMARILENQERPLINSSNNIYFSYLQVWLKSLHSYANIQWKKMLQENTLLKRNVLYQKITLNNFCQLGMRLETWSTKIVFKIIWKNSRYCFLTFNYYCKVWNLSFSKTGLSFLNFES